MTNYDDDIKLECNSCSSRCISRSQLIRVLNSFDYHSFNDFISSSMSDSLEDVWEALDGKELRGNIDGVIGEREQKTSF